MARKKLVSISWKPESYLMDVELLDRLVEFTYFRILNYIYLTQDRLEDNDEKLARLCKCKSVREFQGHKAELLKSRGIDPATGDDLGPRIFVENGFIRSEKCTEKLAEASAFRAQKSGAGQASAEARKAAAEEASRRAKSHTYIYSESAGVGTANATGTPTAGQRELNGKANGAPTEGATADQLPLPSTLTLKSKSPPPTPSKGDDEVQVARLADAIWAMAGQTHIGDRKRASGGVDDYRHVRGWLSKGWSADEIESAARSVIEKAGEITSLWGLLAKAMPEAIDKFRGGPGAPAAQANGEHADIPIVVDGYTGAAQITMAKGYLLEGKLARDGKTIDYTRPKPKAKRRWAFKDATTGEALPGPGEPGCPVHDDAFRRIAEQFGAEWP